MSGNQQGNFPTVVTQEVIEIVAELIAMGMKKFAIKRWIEKEIFQTKICIKSYEKLRTHAKKYLADNAETTKAEHRSMSLDFYRQMASNDSLGPGNRMRAMENLDGIFGIKDSEEDTNDPSSRAAAIRKTLQEAEDSVGANDGIELDIT